MAKISKYSDELLLIAVVRYAEITNKPIVAKDLALWANVNVPELNGVKYYHFTRPAQKKNLKTGDIEMITRPCTLKIEEINKQRKAYQAASDITLLHSSDIDDFMHKSPEIQRSEILRTRKFVEEISNNNKELITSNSYFHERCKALESTIEHLNAKVKEAEDAEKRSKNLLRKFKAVATKNISKQKLAEIGLTDEGFDFDILQGQIQLGPNEPSSFADMISFGNSIMGGIDFE